MADLAGMNCLLFRVEVLMNSRHSASGSESKHPQFLKKAGPRPQDYDSYAPNVRAAPLLSVGKCLLIGGRLIWKSRSGYKVL